MKAIWLWFVGATILLSIPSHASSSREPDPIGEAIDRAVATYWASEPSGAPGDPVAGKVLEGLDIESFEARHFERLLILLDLAPSPYREAIDRRLFELADRPGMDGAIASSLLPRIVPFDTTSEETVERSIRERIRLADSASRHPHLGEALAAGHSTSVFIWAFYHGTHPEMIERGVTPRLAALADDRWPVSGVGDLITFVEGAVHPDAGLPASEVERLRDVVASVIGRALDDPEIDADQREQLERVRAILSGEAARAGLIGRKAPQLHFLWTSDEAKPATLDDYREKIVVLDFWATWCGPCIASFPKTREMRERYRDLPVVILGVTSLQGWISRPWAEDPKQRQQRNLDEQTEVGLTAEWVERMNMTWPVVITRQHVFNPEYAIRAIPAVVIVDPWGTVRFSDLHPNDPKLESHIDSLLMEMGIQPPAPRAAQPEAP